jgi:hypothetical protein
MWKLRCLIFIQVLVMVGCVDLTVEKVDKNDPKSMKANGVRYSLPKPFIQVIPQKDDTINVSYVLLPDSEHTYAVRSWSFMSNYVYQVTVTQAGLLSAVEFKQDTSTVGQQLAASAAGVATQMYNIKLADQLATQTAVNTAQTAVDSARTAYDQARVLYDMDGGFNDQVQKARHDAA